LFLIIANGFKGFDKEATTDALFFAMVRDESYSYVYPDGDWGPRFPRDYIVSLPQKEAGPYLVIPITQVLMRAVPQVRVRSDRRSRPHHKEDGQP
jgi:hypothetical protein